MKPEEKANLQRWVDTWKQAGPLPERIREEKIRAADKWAAFEAFAGLPLLINEKRPPEPYSGLVEQQRWFRKIAAQSKAGIRE